MNAVDAQSDRSGIVESFDTDAGLGTIRSNDGLSYQFHCIEIADGTRHIEVDTPVAFDVLPKLGRYEASNVVTRK